MIKRFAAALLALVLLVSLSACADNAKGSTAASSETQSSAGETVSPLAGLVEQSGDPEAVAMKTEHFTVTQGELVYMFAETFYYYSYYLPYYGVDVNSSLKAQMASEGSSWYDVLMEDTLTNTAQCLQLCEKALEFGFSLDDEEVKAASESVKLSIATQAAASHLDEDSYVSQALGTVLPEKYAVMMIEKQSLADKAYTAIQAAVTVSDEEVEAAVQAHPELCCLCDYYLLTVDSAIGEERVADFRSRFAEVSGKEAFEALAGEYFLEEAKAANLELTLPESEYIQSCLIKGLYEGMTYSEYSDVSAWIYSEKPEEGAVRLEDHEQGGFTACLLIRAPYRDSQPLVDVRHILFKTDTYGSAEAARAKADEIYRSWVAGGADEKTFIDLCAQYSGDGNAASGGLYTEVYDGMMVQSFNEWIFNESRKKGDHGIVDTTFGSHIMFFVDRYESWYSSARNSVLEEKILAEEDKMRETYPVTEYAEVISTVNW